MCAKSVFTCLLRKAHPVFSIHFFSPSQSLPVSFAAFSLSTYCSSSLLFLFLLHCSRRHGGLSLSPKPDTGLSGIPWASYRRYCRCRDPNCRTTLHGRNTRRRCSYRILPHILPMPGPERECEACEMDPLATTTKSFCLCPSSWC